MIIDCHTHLYPKSVYLSPSDWATPRKEFYWLDCVAPKSGPQLQGWATSERMLEDMASAKIDHAISLAWYWENHDTCRENFEWQRDARAAHHEKLLFFAPFNANGEADAIALLEEAFALGFHGMGEINPPAQGYSYRDPCLDNAVELCARHGKPINIHVTEPLGRPYPGKIATPFDELQALARRHPHATFIFAHLGGLIPFHEFARSTRKDLANVYYDTAAVPLLYRSSVYRRIVDCIGSERILFGTDYPLKTFPKTQFDPDFNTHLRQIQTAGLTDEERTHIFAGNAIKLFHLNREIEYKETT